MNPSAIARLQGFALRRLQLATCEHESTLLRHALRGIRLASTAARHGDSREAARLLAWSIGSVRAANGEHMA